MSVYEVIGRWPDIETVRNRCRAMAMLDAILSPEWEDRYFSYDSAWSSTEELASMRNGSGDEYSITFTPAGAFARGFDHESALSPFRRTPIALWPGLLDGVPAEFDSCVAEPAFADDGVLRATVACWRTTADTEWRCGSAELPGDAADGAHLLFEVLTGGQPESYQKWAEEYYEMSVDLDAISHVYALEPLTNAVVTVLNPDVDVEDLVTDIEQIGYPVSR